MFRILLLLFLMTIPATSFAQIYIGDIEVESLRELFNKENEMLWNGTGVLNKSDSKVWISNMPSMIFEAGDKTSIILGIKKDLNQDSVKTSLVEQLNKQFGKFEVTRDSLFEDNESLEWRTEEKGLTYLFSLSKDQKVKGLVIIQK